MASSFHLIDWLIVGAYLAAMGGVGVYFSRKQTSLNQFLLADAAMGWLPVGLSLMAALNSGMDYLMQPSSTIRYGAVLVVGITSWLALYPWVAQVAFPFYHRLNFFTVYEYLEARFDVRVRTLAALIFILWRLGWMATAMYVPSLAINAATGGQVDLNTMTIIVGVLVTLVHDARRHPGRDLERRDPVLHHVRRPGRDGRHRVVERARRLQRDLVGRGRGRQAGRRGRRSPIRRRPASIAQIDSFFQQPMNVIALLVALVVGRMAQYTSDQVMVQRLQTHAIARRRRARRSSSTPPATRCG